MKVRRKIAVAVLAVGLAVGFAGPAAAVSDDKAVSVPGGGTLTSIIWRGAKGTSGNP